MSCNIMVTTPNDCPPTCTASALPSPGTRFFCQQNSALIASADRGGQGAFAGKGSAIPTPTNDASLSAAQVPSLATGGQQDSGGFVITQTSVQVVTVGASAISGGSVRATSSSPIFTYSGAVETSKSTFSIGTSSLTTFSPSATTSMTETTASASPLIATKHKSFIQTTGGLVTILLIVMVVLVGAIIGGLFWRRTKKMKAREQRAGDGEACEAASRRDAGDWSAGHSVPLTGATVAGPEYRASVPVARIRGFESQGRPTKMEGVCKTQKMMASGTPEETKTAKAPVEPQSDPLGRVQPDPAISSGSTTAMRTGQLAPPRERFSISSSVYSGDSDPEGISRLQQIPATIPRRQATGASQTHRRTAKERERNWEANAISGAPESVEAADRAANEARERKLKMEADATQATQLVKDSWDPTKNISTGPPRPIMKPSQGVGPKARREPDVEIRDSGLGLEFNVKKQRELDAEIHELMDQSHPARLDGQEYDCNAQRGPPVIPVKSPRRDGMKASLVEVKVSEEEMERRREWMEAGKEERRRERNTTGKTGRRQASPIQDNDIIQSERVEWGFVGTVKVGNPYSERVEKGGIGRTPLPVDTTKVIREHHQRRKGAPF